MRRVGITQRVEIVSGRDERRDALDQAWLELLQSVGFLPVLIGNRLNDPVTYAKELGVEALVLSGGNDLDPGSAQNAPDRDRTEKALLEWAAEWKIPALGVCRGFQMMNVYLGGGLARVAGHVRNTHTLTTVPGHSLRSLPANSFHDWGITRATLAASFEAVYFAEDGTIEAAYHRELPWTGVMWHPERAIPEPSFHHEMTRRLLLGHDLVSIAA